MSIPMKPLICIEEETDGQFSPTPELKWSCPLSQAWEIFLPQHNIGTTPTPSPPSSPPPSTPTSFFVRQPGLSLLCKIVKGCRKYVYRLSESFYIIIEYYFFGVMILELFHLHNNVSRNVIFKEYIFLYLII